MGQKLVLDHRGDRGSGHGSEAGSCSAREDDVGFGEQDRSPGCSWNEPLQRSGTLPTVWIPSAELRDQRELFRTRMVFTQQRTRLKNRIHATLAKYALRIEESSDAFSKKGRKELTLCLAKLPPHTRYATECLLRQLDSVTVQVAALEARMREVFAPNSTIQDLMSSPGVGFILAVVIFSEVGDVGRFGSASRFASYSETTPRVHASGGKIRYGQLRSDVNRYLKWAFAEAANVSAVNHCRWPSRHVSRLYEQVRHRKGHQTAIGAVARHLAESTYWMLKRQEEYRKPKKGAISSTRR